MSQTIIEEEKILVLFTENYTVPSIQQLFQ